MSTGRYAHFPAFRHGQTACGCDALLQNSLYAFGKLEEYSGEVSAIRQSRAGPTGAFAELVSRRRIEEPGSVCYTFLDYSDESARELSRAQLEQQACTAGAWLEERGLRGKHILLLYPPGLDFISALFGCFFAGAVAVPAQPPPRTRRPGADSRFLAIARDCGAAAVLTTPALSQAVAGVLQHIPIHSGGFGMPATDWQPYPAELNDPALLQYTSGSTGSPRGVMLSHGNLWHNQAMIQEAFDTGPSSVFVSWLPPYHDMGLIGSLMHPIYAGGQCYLFAPGAFMRRPFRWLECVSRFRATISGGPNFAFDLCTRRITEQERELLDLSSWRIAFNGAEPVRQETLQRFAARFGERGFEASAFYPCYGLAEATLFVSGRGASSPPLSVRLDRALLERGKICEANGDERPSAEVVGCGRLSSTPHVAIVDPESGERFGENQVGEICVAGPSVAKGYWNKPEETQAVFAAAGGLLRTGDLGFIRSGELFVTGRIKDLIIVQGRNLYPQDLERAAEASDSRLRPGGGAAFSIEAGGEEQVVILHEVIARCAPEEYAAVLRAMRRSVEAEFEVPLYSVALLAPGALPRTSSGKVRRQACRAAFLSNALPALVRFQRNKPADPAPLAAEEMEKWMAERVASLLHIPAESVRPEDSFDCYGLDSGDAVALSLELESRTGRVVSPAMLYENPTIAALARRLSDDGAANMSGFGQTGNDLSPETRALPLRYTRLRGSGTDSAEDAVAVVGLACRFPGADNAQSFWELLRNGIDAVTEVPASRWDPDFFYDPDPNTPGKMYTRYGAFLRDVDRFDAHFFGISPREAVSLDPQQRLLLEVTWEALEDAGQAADALAGTRTGVYIGISNEEYSSLRPQDDAACIDPYTGTGVAFSVAAGRLSYFLGLQGPNLAVDTACSSSLVSVHLARQALRSGECDLALAGGVNLVLSPRGAIYFSKLRAMALDGRCKTFDAAADGYVRGEGCGMVVLKRLSDAQAAGDRILAVLRGSAINHDGHSGGLTVPNGLSQQAVIREALAAAGIRGTEIGYVEAHGTGTPLGDPIEIRALAAVLGGNGTRECPLYIGSVKTNIGHLESAAGIAGLIKTVLSLHHRTIPPHLHFKELNPHIPLDEVKGVIPVSATPWPENLPRAAGVSSFGISGTNAHLVLAEAPPAELAEEAPEDFSAPRECLLPISARHPESLDALAGRYVAVLRNETENQPRWLEALCQAAGVRRAHHDYGLAVTAATRYEAAEKLEAYLRGEARPGVVTGRRVGGRAPSVAFVFPGQGSQWPGMGRELLDREPAFRHAMEECDRAVRIETGWSVLEQLTQSDGELDGIHVIQPVLFALQVALAALWKSWGVVPDAVVGHSMGEVAAACVAGALSLEDAASIICRRSRLMRRISGQGSMAMVELSMERAAQLLAGGYQQRVSIAAGNGPRSTVLAGDPEALDELLRVLERREIFCRKVRVDVASHSPQVDPLAADLLEELKAIAPKASAIPIYSTVTAATSSGAEFEASYWMRNLREPVLFGAAVEKMIQAGHTCFVEIGPHPILLPAIEQSLAEAGRQGATIASMRRDTGEQSTMLAGLGALYAQGYAVEWKRLYPRHHAPVSLPAYPWRWESFWLEDVRDLYGRRRSITGPAHPLLGDYFASSVHEGTHFWERELSAASLPYLKDHAVEGAVVLPAAAYAEMALAAATEVFGTGPHALADVELRKALIWPKETKRTVQVTLEPRMMGSAGFHISSRAEGDAQPWTLHATGTVRLNQSASGTLDAATLREFCSEPRTGEEHYQLMQLHGLEYGPCFRGVVELWRRPGEALARIRLPERVRGGAAAYCIHPVLLDCALQLMGAAALEKDARADAGTAYLPVGIGSLRMAGFRGVTECWGYARLAGESGEAFLINSDGKALMEARDIKVQQIGSRGSASKIEDWFFELRWQEAGLEPAPPGDLAGRWLIFTDRAGAGDALASAMHERGAECVIVRSGKRYEASNAAAYVVDPSTPENFQRLLTEAGNACRGIVHLWNLDAHSEVTAENLADAESLGSISVLHLVQAMALHPWRDAPRLWLVTAGAQPTGPETSRLRVAQSPVWGLGRVIALEHPEFQCTRVDLDPAGSASEQARLLASELASGSPEDQVAFRDAKRLVARLARYVPPPVEEAWEEASGGTIPFRAESGTPGILDSIALRRMERKAPGPGEIEIAVRAAGLNFADVMKAMGIYPGLPPGPIPLGGECSGVVTQCGAGSDDFEPGDELVAFAPFSFGSHVTIPCALAVRKPPQLSPEEAAGMPVAFLTAWYALYHLGRLSGGESVLIHSASGGVGLAAIQLAKRAGARIFATAGTPEKREFLRSLGLEHVMDSRTLAFVEEVRRATSGRGVDVVLNSLAGEAMAKSLSLLAPFGRFLEIGKRDIYMNSRMGLEPFQKSLAFFAVDLERLFRDKPSLMISMFREMIDAAARGELEPITRHVMPVSQVAEAFRLMAGAKHTGKIVLSMADEDVRVRVPVKRGFTVRSDRTYLITGGLGALGLTVARWLVDSGARHLALVGRRSRSSLPGQAEDAIEELKRCGAAVVTLRADVSKTEELAAALDSVRAGMPPLGGVIHAAGVLDDGLLLRMDARRFRNVTAAKVWGAWNLHALTAGDPLECFVLFSSAASLLGSPGQGNYAAANAFLDALAHYRRGCGLPAISINWGPWADTGLAAAADQIGRLAWLGFESIGHQQGAAVLARLLDASPVEAAVIPFHFSRWLQQYPKAAEAPVLAELLVESRPRSQQDLKETPLRKELLALDAGWKRRERLEAHLREQAAQVLRLSKTQVDIRAPLQSMGFDSLMALELRNRLEASLGVPLSATMAWNYPTIADLAGHLAQKMGIALEQPEPAAASGAEESADGDLLAVLNEAENLPEEELARMQAAGGNGSANE